MKKYIIGILIGLIFATSIGVYAAIKYQASEIEYNNTPLDEVLDDLYSKASSGTKLCKFIDGTYGSKGNVGAKYECKLKDGETRYFYIFKINSNNSVNMILANNLEEDGNEVLMTANYTSTYFTSGDGKKYYNLWPNVINIDVPSASDVATAVGYTNWNNTDYCLDTKSDVSGGVCTGVNTGKYAWLYGQDYFTKTAKESNHQWAVTYSGHMRGYQQTASYGIRPVITILKSSLYE